MSKERLLPQGADNNRGGKNRGGVDGVSPLWATRVYRIKTNAVERRERLAESQCLSLA